MLLDANLIIFLALVVFVGSTIKTTAGFGFALISVPLLLPFLELNEIVPIILPLVLINDYAITARNKGRLKPKVIVPMASAATLGIPLGILILSNVSMYMLKIFVSIIVLVAAFLLLSGKTLTIRKEGFASIFAGFLSGVLVSTSGLSGPPVTLFLINQQWQKLEFRNNLGLYFAIVDSIAVISLLLTGFIDNQSLVLDLMLTPSVLAGYLLGNVLLKSIRQEVFVKMTVLVIIIGATLTLFNTLNGSSI